MGGGYNNNYIGNQALYSSIQLLLHDFEFTWQENEKVQRRVRELFWLHANPTQLSWHTCYAYNCIPFPMLTLEIEFHVQ